MNFSNDTNYPTDDAPLSLMPPEQLPPPETLTKPSFWRGLGSMLRELVETLILTLVIFLLIRFAVQNFRIEGYSMEPNFHDGQFLFVNKLVYMLGKPERGDVIVFVPPTSASRDYIKRVIGLPGDKVEIINGTVYINDQVLNEAYPLNPATYSMPPLIVPPDEYFVLGDNRNFSSDSHSWGTVHASKIIGRAWISYWPPQLIGFVPTYSYAANK